MKRKLVTLLLALSIATISITACGHKTTGDIEINTETTESSSETEMVAEIESLPWLQLSSLETHPELRQAFDEYFGITGTTGNKEGKLYYNPVTQKADQNVTLFMALRNTAVQDNFFVEDLMLKLGEIAAEHYADVEADDLNATYATINAYFELLPDQEEGQFDGDSTISRAQAMTLLMRATTPVNEAQAPEVNADFTSKVGESQYTDFAAPMNEYSYLNTSNGLNEGVFNSAMSRGEYICMITNLLKSEYQAILEDKGYNDLFADTEVALTTVTDGGDITFADAIGDTSKGVPTDMYKTFETAVQYGLLTEDLLEDWDSSLTKSEAIQLFIAMTSCYTHNTAIGFYSGYQSPEEIETEEARFEEESSIEKFAEANLPGEGTTMKRFQNWAISQGADYALGWTFVYLNGKAAGSQPTYGVYMKPDSPLYGTVYHVGDIIPDGSRLDGTREEDDALQTERAKQQLIEEGGKVYTDPETGKTIWEIP